MELFLTFSVIGWKNLFYKSFTIWSKDFKLVFRNRKRNDLTRNWNYFSPFQISDKKLLLQKLTHLVHWSQNGFQKQEKELHKQEMELFFPFLVIWSKNLFYKSFPIWSDDSKMVSRKQDMELSKEEKELFLPFPVIRSKNFFYKSYPIWFTDPKMVCRNRKWNYFSPFWSSDQKTYVTKVSTFGSMIPKWFPENRKWNYLKRKKNYFSPFWLSDQKTFFTKISLFGLPLPNWFSETGNGIM